MLEILPLILIVLFISKSEKIPPTYDGKGVVGPLVTELHELCTVSQGRQARCGPGSTCLVIGGIPTCHCIRDVATGLPLAGNPYRGCTFDITGVWELDYFDGNANRPFFSALSHTKYVFSIKRTDAILKTRYITGNIFIVTPVSPASATVATRAFVDINDNSSIIIETAEGFVDAAGRSLYLRSHGSQVTLNKVFPKKVVNCKEDLSGGWRREDGSRVKIYRFHNTPYWSNVIDGVNAYWYNDESHGLPHLRLSTTLFLDETLNFEKKQFETTERFIQLGWYGKINKGVQTISIISPADGTRIFTLRKISEFVEEPTITFEPTAITIQGHDEISAILEASHKSIYGNKPFSSNQDRQLISTDSSDYLEYDMTKSYLKIINDLGDKQADIKRTYISYPENKNKFLNFRKLEGIFDRIITQEFAKSINRDISASQPTVDLPYKSSLFFGLNTDEQTPYNYLYTEPANRLEKCDFEKDHEFRHYIERAERRQARRRRRSQI